MITAWLAMAVVACLFYGRIALEILVPLCVGTGVALALLGRHKHTQFLTIDIMAQISRLKRVNAALKFFAALALMALCVASNSPVVGMFLTAAMLLLTVCVGGLALRDYVHLLALPVSFVMLSALALLFEVTSARSGVLSFHVFGVWLCVSANAQAKAALVLARALGAVSCLYLLSLTTPMSELIGVLRRMRCPKVCIELMYLIYRYIFILLTMYHTMRAAAESRLGYATQRAGMHTAGNLYANLLARSFQQARRHFDAMESRCYDAEIRFLESRKRVTFAHAAAAAGLTLLTLAMTLVLH